MKSYTDIEQSKKLMEILPLESADGFYEAQINPFTNKWEDILFIGNEWASDEVVIPAWSLSALLNLLPHTDMDGVELNNYSGDKKVWTALFHWKNMYTQIKIADNPLDAVFEVVCWFLENKEIINDKK